MQVMSWYFALTFSIRCLARNKLYHELQILGKEFAPKRVCQKLNICKTAFNDILYTFEYYYQTHDGFQEAIYIIHRKICHKSRFVSKIYVGLNTNIMDMILLFQRKLQFYGKKQKDINLTKYLWILVPNLNIVSKIFENALTIEFVTPLIK